MATEILAVPEDNLVEVIAVIRSGLLTVQVSPDTREALTRWCDEEEAYIKGEEGSCDGKEDPDM